MKELKVLLMVWTGKPPLDVKMAPKDQPDSKSASTWTWFPSWHELTTHYFKEVGFIACLSQMIGATVFVSKPVFYLISFYGLSKHLRRLNFHSSTAKFPQNSISVLSRIYSMFTIKSTSSEIDHSFWHIELLLHLFSFLAHRGTCELVRRVVVKYTRYKEQSGLNVPCSMAHSPEKYHSITEEIVSL